MKFQYKVVDPRSRTRPVRIAKRPRNIFRAGCLLIAAFLTVFLLLTAVYFLAPLRTNILVLGIDRRPEEGAAPSRTDTMILTTIVPLKPYVGMLSIPRDLWVTVPGIGENRVNTAYFFAENERAGNGSYAAMDTVRLNFGVDVNYYVLVEFDSVQRIADNLGGVEIYLDTPMSGYPAGTHRLNGEQSLAFVRDRQGTDDFFRMSRGQLFLKSLGKQMLNPGSWEHIPNLALVIMDSVETNIPFWLWPRLGFALLRAGPDGIDSQVISREMVNPFTTSGGAQVLAPNWDNINPMLMEMFGQ
jgi:LCP family protein required for cell wall assembly